MTRRPIDVSRLGDRRGRSPVSPAYWVRRAAMTWRHRSGIKPVPARPARSGT